jgi:hypothetical protein
MNLLIFHSIIIWKIRGIPSSISYHLNIDALDNRHPHIPIVDMTPPSTWFVSKLAYTADEMYAGDGCHSDESQVLSHHLHGNFN